MQNLKGKKAVITGGSRGIGKATALELASEGVELALIARSLDSFKEIKAVLDEMNAKYHLYAADVSNESEVNKAAEKIVNDIGTIDILINNAGIGASGSFIDLTTDQWNDVYQTNVMGIVHITKAFLPTMIENQKGDIINISSMSGLKGTKGSSAYSASKFAVIGLSESLMQEVRTDNIRVSVLTPSLVETDMTRGNKNSEKNPEKYTQAEDLAEYITSLLKLENRTFIKTSAIWATNPF